MAPDKILKKYLEDKNTDTDRVREVGIYHASRLGRCLKQTFLRYTLPEEKQPSKEDAWGKFQLGDQIEWLYEQALKNYYGYGRVANSIETEFTVDKNITIIGHTDPVLLGKNLEAEKVYEVKSTKDVSNKRKYGPSEHHVQQLNVYMQALKSPGKIVYIDKQDLDTEVFEKEFDLKMFKRGVERIKELDTYLRDGETPPAKPFNSSWECDYCGFRDAGFCGGC